MTPLVWWWLVVQGSLCCAWLFWPLAAGIPKPLSAPAAARGCVESCLAFAPTTALTWQDLLAKCGYRAGQDKVISVGDLVNKASRCRWLLTQGS